MKPAELQKEIARTIQERGWTHLLLAVSGGLDSICLADYFTQNKDALGIQNVAIAHVHHGLREVSADLDRDLVKNFADTYGIPFYVKYLDGGQLKAAEGSLEEAAREARYQALKEIVSEHFPQRTSEDIPARVAILTAHHSDDLAETLLIRLRRGVTLAGLRGIQSIRQFENLEIYRPFLKVSRAELLEYAQERNLSWREDESNTDLHFTRNQVRHRLLPSLEKSNPGASKELCHVATLAEKAYESALALAERTYSPLVIPPEDWPFDKEASPFTKVLALDAEKLQCTGELFRLWLDQKGFRFPIETFPEKGENKAFPSKQSYRNRFIEKCRHIVWIFDQSTARKSENLYFLKDKLDFSHVDGTWRYPQKDDVLLPLDSKISSRPLRQWLQEKGVPQWIRPYLRVLAKENWVHFVSGIRTKRKD